MNLSKINPEFESKFMYDADGICPPLAAYVSEFDLMAPTEKLATSNNF